MPATTSPERYLELPYHIAVTKDGDAWRAAVEELPGCEARGGSASEATQRVREAMRAWIASALESGREIPGPRSAPSYSGKLLLRMPQSLHAELANAAEREGSSLNNYIVAALAGAVGGRREENGHEPAAPEARSTWLRPMLVANIAVVALVALIAIVLLIVAWQQGW